VVVRETTIEGGVGNNNFRFEGSQALPVSPSDRGARKRERERERGSWGGSERHYNRGGSETIIFYLKVPRHCRLVLLIMVGLEFRVN
jgi:hypothetical protein